MCKLGGGIAHHKTIRALYYGEAQALAEALLGPGCCDDSNLAAQIALRFPECDDDGDDPTSPSTGTKDMPMWHTDGLRQGRRHPFSLLVGVCLSDVAEERSGNL